MSTLVPRASALACLLVLSAIPLSGCVVPGGGYGYSGGGYSGGGYSGGGYSGGGYSGGGVGFADYYQPQGVEYGGWGAGYQVGPPRGGERRADHGNYHPGPHAYRPAPASHRMPSIPSHSRGGGTHRD